MSYYFGILIALMLGSFYNLLIYRLPRGQDIVIKRSYCPNCQHSLGPADLIPVLSYVFQVGKCRYCRHRIPWRYPLVEILSGVLFWICITHFPLGWPAAKAFIFLSVLLVLFFTDVETMLLPDWLTYGLFLVGTIESAISGHLLFSLAGSLVGFGVFFTIGVLGKLAYKQDALGWGDIKLSAGIGSFLGAKMNLIAIFLSFLIGSVYSLAFLISGKKTRKDPIPFGPAIILGAIVVFFYGDALWAWYIQ